MGKTWVERGGKREEPTSLGPADAASRRFFFSGDSLSGPD